MYRISNIVPFKYVNFTACFEGKGADLLYNMCHVI